ncbi:hypothetical protein Tsubulata_033329 [Turnera subulata]|uniref:Dirigent protein n=1 Tax=Turnera subulata TaxID=218843 RepID=A0A9Q0JQV3_9ROSI|nr:hypothetical protein Tsubulata_033329 [Turnera subulata]
MAKFTFTLILNIFIVCMLSLAAAKSNSSSFSRNLSPETLGLKKEKLTHLHFYFHDLVGGQHPTSVRVAQAPTTNSSSTLFCLVTVIDNPLTATPELSSKLVGRAQGIYASASQNGTALLMVFDLVFTEGKFNGSSLSVLGRNSVFSSVREMPIVGGTGVFRFARGHAEARTHSFDFVTLNAVVGYDVYVLHY